MSIAQVQSATHPSPRLNRYALIEAAGLAGALALVFWHFLSNQIRFSLDPDWSYAFLIPVISLYYVYDNRRTIFADPPKPTWLGLPLILAGIAIYFVFTLGPTWNHTVQGGAAILCLMGVVLCMVGTTTWTRLLFPQLYLLLGVRVSPRVLLLITPTLQRWAAVGSYYLLNMIGYDTEISGNVLTVFHDGESIPLNVAEACSGMRMIVAFLALGIAMAFFRATWWWQRALLIALALPIAILINVLRVATIGVMSTFNAEWAGGDAHMFLGVLWLVPALFLYLGIAWVLDHLVIIEDGSDDAGDQRVGNTAETGGAA